MGTRAPYGGEKFDVSKVCHVGTLEKGHWTTKPTKKHVSNYKFLEVFSAQGFPIKLNPF